MPPDSAPFPRVELGGLRFHACTLAQTVDWIASRVADRRTTYAISPNVDGLCRFHRYPDIREDYLKAHLVLADGMPLVWLSRWMGQPLPERVAGSDLIVELCRVASEKGFRIYLLGAEPGVGDEAKRRLEQRFPGICVCGVDAPPFGFENVPEQWTAVLDRIRTVKPDILFVALGSDRQKRFITRTMDAFDIPFRMGVGASIDFLAERQKRAPGWVRCTGAEWLWRLASDPRRLFGRYILEDFPFFLRLAWDTFRRGRRA
jgi:N-acetylglucosaminyldiphosphoundecaprenol N-acetyl-beta-D-mannosaminyltransferase